MESHESSHPTDDEPQTPLGFTLLGMGLFLIGAIYALACGCEEPEAGAQGNDAATAAAAAP